MPFQKRLIQVFLILNLVIAFLIFYRCIPYLKSQSEEEPVLSIENTGEKFKFTFHVENTTKDFRCTFTSANFTIYDFDKSVYSNFHCVPVYILKRFFPICVHNKLTNYAKQNLREIEQEEPVLKEFERILRNNVEYDVIDIGSHMGLYSLLAAKLQRLVFAVEPMNINAKIFHQTVIINRIETLVTLVGGRPLSDDYKTIQMTAFNNGIVSWIHYSVNGYRPRDKHVIATESAKTILMDDLLNAVPFYKAIMVIDLDGHEASIIKSGQRFIECLDIAYIFMKWTKLLINDQTFIIDFFSKKNYAAHTSTKDFRELSFDSFHKWPPNIVWKKNNKRKFRQQ